MICTRRAASALGIVAALLAADAGATTLQEAIEQAVAHEPGLARVEAEGAVAQARLDQAKAARLPTLALAAQAGEGRTDYGDFFGFGENRMSPRAASVKIEQPLFAGGALNAGVARAAGGRAAAQEVVRGTRLNLEARVAAAYGDVLVAEESFRLNRRQVEVAAELARQAGLRFQTGEIPRTDQAQAEARAAQARAAAAQAQGELAGARARLRSLTGEEPGRLEPVAGVPPIPASLEEAMAAALRTSPGLAASLAAARGAKAGVRQARGGFLPSIAFVAEAGAQRDQFFPGYRADGYTVGVQARWSLFSSGMQSAKVSEAQAQRRAAEAAALETRLGVEEAVITFWNAVEAADHTAAAAQQQVVAAEAAEASLGHEVKVNAKPLVDLLDAQRETLGARTALARANADRIAARYRLRAVVGAE